MSGRKAYEYFKQFILKRLREKKVRECARYKKIPSWVFSSLKEFKRNLIVGFF